MVTVMRAVFFAVVACILFEISQTFPDASTNSPVTDGDSTREGHRRRLQRPVAATPQGHQPSGDRIYFPGDPEYPVVTSRLSPDPDPECTDLTFCEDVPNYPYELISHALEARGHEFKHLANVDPPPDVGQRFGSSDFESLCDVQSVVVYPKAARKPNNEWLFVVNMPFKKDKEDPKDTNFLQGFRVEICRKENSTCRIVAHGAAAAGYDTECKQQYISRQALVFDKPNLVEEPISLPVSCCCHIRSRSDLYSRLADIDDDDDVTSREAGH